MERFIRGYVAAGICLFLSLLARDAVAQRPFVPQMAGGYGYSLALRSDGTIWATGVNYGGQLGDGTTTDRLIPVQVADGIIAMGVGYRHSIALRYDGTMLSWGVNHGGALGRTDVPVGTYSADPGQITGAADIIAVDAGGTFSMALDYFGRVWTWGDNSSGELGDGSTVPYRPTPAPVPGLTGVVAIAASPGSTAYALRNDGTVWAWGDNHYGQVGNAHAGSIVRSPVKVDVISGVRAIAAGMFHALALTSDGTVWAWGDNSRGQLGDGTYTTRTQPVPLTSLPGVHSIAAGGYHSLAIARGIIFAWGANDHGQLGDGSFTDSPRPLQVVGMTDVVAVEGGIHHTLARHVTHTVSAWGQGVALGANTTADQPLPVAQIRQGPGIW